MAAAYPDKLLELVSASVTEFFESAGTTATAIPAGSTTADDEQQAIFSASLGFSGDAIKGAVVVIAGAPLLASTNPQREFVKAFLDSDHGDWIGEMANQIVGALKRRAAGYKVDFLLSTPTVVHGKALEVARSQKDQPSITCYKVGAHIVRIHFTAALGEGAKFEGEPDTSEQAAGGDTMLF